MKARDIAKIGVSLAMLSVAAAVLVNWLNRPAEGGQDVTRWLCTDAACGAEFTKSVMEIARLRQGNPDANPPCPRCGKATTVRAFPCPHCGRFLRLRGHGFMPKTCPYCQQPTVEKPAEVKPEP
jgi:hypothetical protein